MQQKVFFPNLDGLRFFCFLSVFIFHSFATSYDYISTDPIYIFIRKHLFVNGNLGVYFFFVLSGFLITYLLLKEKEYNSKIDIKNFYIRRILRIWPLFYFCVFFGFFVFPLLKKIMGGVPDENASIGFYLTFLNNFDMINRGLPDSSILSVLWSIAIEEQFYIIWPLLIAFIPTQYYLFLFSTIIALSIGSSYAFHGNYLYREYHTLTCIGDMAVGGMGAYFIWKSKNFVNYFKTLPRYSIIILYAIALTIFFFRKDLLYNTPVVYIFERTFIAWIFLFIILEQNYSDNSLFKMSNFKTVSELGKLTYGLYCLHFFGILIVATLLKVLAINTQLWQVLLLEGGGSLLVTIILSKLSFKYFEQPFLRLKEKYAFITK